MEELNKLIDFNLKKIFEKKTKYIEFEIFTDLEGNKLNGIIRSVDLAKKMQKNDLINVDKDYTFCSITFEGIEIFENGGWLQHIELEKQKKIIELKKSDIDFTLKKWQLKTFWWIFGFAMIGSGLSVYNFINSLMPSKVIEQEEKIIRMESELSKLRTLFLYQKKVNSLPNTNSYRTKRIKNSALQ